MVVSTGSGIRDVFSRVSHGNAGSGAWLLLSTDVRQHGGNDGYADEIGSSYKWDSTVPNHRGIAVGDLVLLWDKVQLLGASVVAGISTGTKVKNRHRCPTCRSTKIKRRANALPDGSYRCHGCRTSFFEPDTEAILVDTFETDHRDGLTCGELSPGTG